MKIGLILGVFLIATVFFMPSNVEAFECPVHFAEAQAAIDKVAADMESMSGMDKEMMALVHSLLDDAKMFLSGGIHNHEKPQGKYDHARSIAKADTALGYAKAAAILMEKM